LCCELLRTVDDGYGTSKITAGKLFLRRGDKEFQRQDGTGVKTVPSDDCPAAGTAPAIIMRAVAAVRRRTRGTLPPDSSAFAAKSAQPSDWSSALTETSAVSRFAGKSTCVSWMMTATRAD